MWDKFNSWFDSTIDGDPIYYGLIFILISFALLALRLYFKESSRMKDHNEASWFSFVNSWSIPFWVRPYNQ